MPYLISFAKWPSHKSGDVMKKAIEALKKFPADESLGEGLVSGNAIKASEEGVKSISVLNVSQGKLEAAYHRSKAESNFYDLSIEGAIRPVYQKVFFLWIQEPSPGDNMVSNRPWILLILVIDYHRSARAS